MTTTQDPLKSDIKQAIVRSLRLPIAPDDIGDATPLFGEGLGLDSIDVLELVGMKVLGSVDTIASFIVTERAKRSA